MTAKRGSVQNLSLNEIKSGLIDFVRITNNFACLLMLGIIRSISIDHLFKYGEEGGSYDMIKNNLINFKILISS